MARSVEDLIRIAHSGASFIVDGRQYVPTEMIRVAAECKLGGGRFEMLHTATYSTDDLVRIAEAAGGRVFFALLG
ncbi:MAG: hypothetical protein H6581_31100 [Bacteroidia bacterium]|nr:hypothetical protein [Bacteroidia bacterium]